jgi:hypothetical protein
MNKTTKGVHMKKWIAASLISMMTVTSVFADCSNAYEVKARARAELIKDVKKAGAITGTVVISATTLATMAVIFVAIPGPGWFLIPPAFGLGTEAAVSLANVASDVRVNELNTFYKALGTITSAKKGALPKELIKDLNKKMNLESLSTAEQAETLKDVVEMINRGNESNLFCQRNENGHYKIYSYKKLLKHIVNELN